MNRDETRGLLLCVWTNDQREMAELSGGSEFSDRKNEGGGVCATTGLFSPPRISVPGNGLDCNKIIPLRFHVCLSIPQLTLYGFSPIYLLVDLVIICRGGFSGVFVPKEPIIIL